MMTNRQLAEALLAGVHGQVEMMAMAGVDDPAVQAAANDPAVIGALMLSVKMAEVHSTLAVIDHLEARTP